MNGPVASVDDRQSMTYIGLPNNANRLLRSGFSADDVSSVSDRVFDGMRASPHRRPRGSMPLFTITMRSGRTAIEKDAMSAAIHQASVSAGYPEDDHFQRFFTLAEDDFRVSPLYPDLTRPRSEHVLMIEVLVSSGTETDRKRSLLSAIVTRLQAAGTDPNDVMIFFGEIDRASSSFGGGRAAPPVKVRP